MKQEIKERIEQINNGVVPKGYKRTKAGLMPNEWINGAVLIARDVFASVSFKNNTKNLEVLSATQDKGVVPRRLVDIDIKYNEENVTGYKKVDKGDFVISLRSFQGGIEYSEYDGLVSPAYTVLKPIQSIVDGYYKAYFKSTDFITRLNKGTYGIRDGKQIGYNDFGNMVIHFPPYEEQEKIAEILSTQDKVIELKEKLIEQKQLLKKHTMISIFTHLKGDTVKLNDIATIDTGNSDTQDKVDNGKYPFFVRSQTVERTNKYSFDGEAILTPGDGKIGEIYHYYIGKFDYHQRVYKISDFKACMGKYIYYYLQMYFKKRAQKLTAKATVDSLRRDMLTDMNIVLPSTNEQRYIVAVMDTMDKHIRLLEQELEQEKQKKKALMQLLLTGIVRVN